MHEIQRPAGGFVAWKMCENTHTMDAPGCAGEASMCIRQMEYVRFRIKCQRRVKQKVHVLVYLEKFDLKNVAFVKM